MSRDVLRRLKQVIGMLVAVVIGVILIYRGNTYADPHGPGMVVPVMCVLSALSLVGTTLAMLMRPREAW